MDARPLATIGARAAAYLLDAAVVSALMAAVLLVPGATGDEARLAVFFGWLAIIVAYFSAFEAGGATPGKRLLRIRVVDGRSGAPIGLRRALIRNLMRLVSAWALYLGFLQALLNDRRETWHDKAAHTLVVSAR